VGYISWVLDGNFYLAARKIFKAAKKGLLKRTSEEEAEVGVLDDVSVDVYGDVADLHGVTSLAGCKGQTLAGLFIVWQQFCIDASLHRSSVFIGYCRRPRVPLSCIRREGL